MKLTGLDKLNHELFLLPVPYAKIVVTEKKNKKYTIIFNDLVISEGQTSLRDVRFIINRRLGLNF